LLGGIFKLASMNVAQNHFRGTLPDELGTLNDLELLDLSSNELDGTIAASIGKLTRVKTIYFQQNWFVGTVPGSIASLPSLQTANFASNNLTGTLPASFWTNPSLKSLSFKSNKLTSLTIPDKRGTCCATSINIGPTVGAGQPTILAGGLRYLTEKSIPVGNITVCATDAANPGMRKNSDPNGEELFEFTLSMVRGCDRKVSLNAMSAQEWTMDLTVECCTHCPTESTLEEVDMSDNNIAGPTPKWLANMVKATIKSLDLKGNRLTGDYRSLDRLSTGLVHVDNIAVTMAITPQQECPAGEYLKTNAKAQYDLGMCEPTPLVKAEFLVQSKEAFINLLQKPSTQATGNNVRLVLNITGGRSFAPQYTTTMMRYSNSQQMSNRTFTHLDASKLSLDGLHTRWQGIAPSKDTVKLDASAGRLSETAVYTRTI
jgi:hypothetical protein